MTKNVGSIDRAARILAGVLLLAFAISGIPATGYNWVGWLGVVPLVTGLLSWCPAYALFGISSCSRAKAKA